MRRLVLSIAVLLAVWINALPAKAELKPEQVAIIGMAESNVSRELAEYYAKARGIPESNILLLEGDPKQRITRYQWEETYRPSILRWLKSHESSSQIRCLVTTWDVPLEISPINPSAPAISERAKHLREARVTLVGQMKYLIRALYSTGGQTNTGSTLPDDASLKDLYSEFAVAMKPAQKWLVSAKSPGERDVRGRFIDRVLVTISGNEGLLRLTTPRDRSPKLTPEQSSRLGYLTGRSEGYRQGMASLNLMRGTVARDEQAIELAQTMGGLFAAIRWIDQQLHLLDKNFTAASFDGELSLILWADPPMVSWVVNPWHYSHDLTPGQRRRTLFVSRLSAPTPAVVRRMIDDTIAAEKSSLKGKVYLDCRAYDAEDQNNVFYQYDQSLLALAARLNQHSTLDIVLDERPEVFAPGTCPEAALYCGWHSPATYVDAFAWSTGAIGYHLSSDEASWLQLNDDDRVQRKTPWCPTMLAQGAAATLGSCREAYLSAFPRPDDFFPLLLTGKYSLVEVYYRTAPFISWTMLLIGDPLYNPYKNSPQLSPRALPERMNPGASRKAQETPQAAEPSPSQPSPEQGGTADEPPSPEAPELPRIDLPGLDN